MPISELSIIDYNYNIIILSMQTELSLRLDDNAYISEVFACQFVTGSLCKRWHCNSD